MRLGPGKFKKTIISLAFLVGSGYFLIFVLVMLSLSKAMLSVEQILVFLIYGLLGAAVLALILWIFLKVVPDLMKIKPHVHTPGDSCSREKKP